MISNDMGWLWEPWSFATTFVVLGIGALYIVFGARQE